MCQILEVCTKVNIRRLVELDSVHSWRINADVLPQWFPVRCLWPEEVLDLATQWL